MKKRLNVHTLISVGIRRQDYGKSASKPLYVVNKSFDEIIKHELKAIPITNTNNL